MRRFESRRNGVPPSWLGIAVAIMPSIARADSFDDLIMNAILLVLAFVLVNVALSWMLMRFGRRLAVPLVTVVISGAEIVALGTVCWGEIDYGLFGVGICWSAALLILGI